MIKFRIVITRSIKNELGSPLIKSKHLLMSCCVSSPLFAISLWAWLSIDMYMLIAYIIDLLTTSGFSLYKATSHIISCLIKLLGSTNMENGGSFSLSSSTLAFSSKSNPLLNLVLLFIFCALAVLKTRLFCSLTDTQYYPMNSKPTSGKVLISNSLDSIISWKNVPTSAKSSTWLSYLASHARLHQLKKSSKSDAIGED